MRYHSGLRVADVFPPRGDKKCARCQNPLKKMRRRWCSDECRNAAVTEFLVRKGDVEVIRAELYKRDKGICAGCGLQKEWQADHIVAVVNGGGGCGLDGYQTLCVLCHRVKTRHDMLKRNLSS